MKGGRYIYIYIMSKTLNLKPKPQTLGLYRGLLLGFLSRMLGVQTRTQKRRLKEGVAECIRLLVFQRAQRSLVLTDSVGFRVPSLGQIPLRLNGHFVHDLFQDTISHNK